MWGNGDNEDGDGDDEKKVDFKTNNDSDNDNDDNKSVHRCTEYAFSLHCSCIRLRFNQRTIFKRMAVCPAQVWIQSSCDYDERTAKKNVSMPFAAARNEKSKQKWNEKRSGIFFRFFSLAEKENEPTKKSLARTTTKRNKEQNEGKNKTR